MTDREEIIRRVVEEVMKEYRPSDGAQGGKGTAFLIGQKPPRDLGWNYVRQGDYEAVVIGSLTPWELLRFPDALCTEALVQGKPVFLWEGALDYRHHRNTCNRALYSRLLSAERQLKELGVQMIGGEETKLLTAQEVRRRLEKGQPIHGRLTPLAKDVLESYSDHRH